MRSGSIEAFPAPTSPAEEKPVYHEFDLTPKPERRLKIPFGVDGNFLTVIPQEVVDAKNSIYPTVTDQNDRQSDKDYTNW